MREAGELGREALHDYFGRGRKGIPMAVGGLYGASTPLAMASDPEFGPLMGAAQLGIAGAIAAQDTENFEKINAARDLAVAPGKHARHFSIKNGIEDDFYDIPDEWVSDLEGNGSHYNHPPEDYYRGTVRSEYMDNPADFIASPDEYIENALQDTQKMVNKDAARTWDITDDRNYDEESASKGYRILPTEVYRGVLEGIDDTFQRSNVRKIGDFGSEIKNSDPEAVKKLVRYLDAEGNQLKTGRDISNTAKDLDNLSFFDKGELLESVLTPEKSDLMRKLEGSPIMSETLESTASVMSPSVDPEIDVPEYVSNIEYRDTSLAETEQGEQLEKVLEDWSMEIGEIERLADIADIDPSWDVAKQAKNYAYQGREIDVDEMEKQLKKEISSKKAEYTREAIRNQGHHLIDSMHEEITGESRDEYTEDHVAALKAYRNFSTNRDAVRKVLKHNKDVYEQGENLRWLEEATVDTETLIEFDEKEYQLGSEGAMDISGRRKELMEETMEHLERLNDMADLDIDPDEVEDIDDIEEYSRENDPELEGEAEDLYEEVFEDAVQEYHDIAAMGPSDADSFTVGLADPVETMNTGSHFSTSCLAVEKVNGWSAAADAVDVNKQTIYAWDENDNVLGRAMVTVTEDDTLSKYSFYSNDNRAEHVLQDYIEDYSEALDLELESYNHDVEVLEADAWYDAAR